MRIALLVAGRDLRSRLRDRSAIVTAFVAPVALALVISFAFQGGTDAFRADAGVLDLDGGPIAGIFVDDVLGSADLREVLPSRAYDDRAALDAALAAGEVDVGFVIHEGAARITVLRAPGAAIAGEVATSVARNFAAQVDGVAQAIGLSVMTTILGPDAFGEEGLALEGFGDPAGVAERLEGLEDADFEALAEEVAEAPLPIVLVDASAGASELSSASYYGPGMAMLFVFFLLAAAPRSLLAEARDGTLARLRAAPVSTTSIVLGKGLAVAALGLASMITVWAVTALVFGASWGDPFAVLVLMVAFLAAALGISTLVSVYARTEGQANGMVSLVAFVLAMLGGNFLFLGDLPVALQRIALLTPNGWALTGFTTLAADGGGVGSVLGPIAAILAFAAVAFALAAPGLRRWTTA